MLFNSLEYLVFIVSVFTLYWALYRSYRYQNILLLFVSYLFYAWWDWRFLSLILFSSIVDYVLGIQIHNTDNRTKKRWLILSIVINLGLLGFFKYFNFFSASLVFALSEIGITANQLALNIILPIGISFYTFQTMSYSIDIFRGKIKPTRDVVSFFTYIAFFPQLVAGPIERASNLLPQINSKRELKIQNLQSGVLQILIGLFRKIVVADSIGIYVDLIYNYPEAYNSSTILIATIFYGFQIYFDFAGYSDIAIGSARILGFKFKRNFDLPYFSLSLSEFWKRWHISLSSWLKDYLYIPIGGNKNGRIKTYRNLLITMLLGGLWHGSSWTFVIWGGIHGIGLCIEKLLKKYIPTKSTSILANFSSWLLAMSVIFLAWIFFRAQNLEKAILALNSLFEFNWGKPYINDLQVQTNSVFVLISAILLDVLLLVRGLKLETMGEKLSLFHAGLVSIMVLLFITLFYSSSLNFIYFQF